MEVFDAKGQRETKGRQGFLRRLTSTTTHYILALALSVVFCIGCLQIHIFSFQDNVPEVGYLGARNGLKFFAHVVYTEEDYQNCNKSTYWAHLLVPLAMLEVVCPEVTKWVIEQHDNNKIEWTEEHNGTYATYNWLNGTLTLNKILFAESEVQKAATLAHEFRHSRQNPAKNILDSLSKIFGAKNNCVEDEAELFEKEVYIAISY